jgi:uncharacterized protein (TIGR02588 family)
MNKKSNPDIPVAEWITAAAGVVILVFMLGALIMDATRGNDRPPDITFVIDSVHAGAGGYVVEVSVRNAGGQTAAGVAIEGSLAGGGAEIERSMITLDYLPAHSTRRVGLVFRQNPRAHAVALRALGYQRP